MKWGRLSCSLVLLALVCGCGDRRQSGQGSSPPPIIVERSATVRSTGETTSFAPIIERVAPSVVSVYSSKNQGRVFGPLTDAPMLRRFFGENGPPRREQSLGSGVIISEEGYILTNNHVIDGADEVRIAMVDGRELIAEVVGVDPATDMAVLKIPSGDLPAAVLADSTDIRVGDLAFAIGNPFGVGQTVTMGIISATERTGFGITEYEDFIQTDAAVNPGNSGGPLIDAEGRVIGINTAILSRSGGFHGIGFAVPINLARFTMEQLIRNGRVIRGYLGIYIQPLTPGIAKAARVPVNGGAVIAGFSPGSPAEAAGLRAGDVITGVNGVRVTGSPELRLAISQIAPGSVARLQVLRRGEELQVPVTVGEIPRRSPDERG